MDPAFFVNRVEVISAAGKAFERSLSAKPPKPDNLAVTGKWGYGKTSLLRKIEVIALQNPRIFTAYVELTPSSCLDFNSFAARVRDEVERSFKTSSISLTAKLKNSLLPQWRIKTIELGIGVGLERKENRQSIITVFEDALRELWKVLEGNGIGLAVLMLDDLHYLAQNYPAGLYDLRGVFQRLAMEGCNFLLVITGPSSLFQIKEFAEPFARFFEKHELGLFGLEETRNSIKLPLKLSKSGVDVGDAVVKEIYENTRGHPYFIHFIMQLLFDSCEGSEITMQTYRDNRAKIAESLARDKFEYDFFSRASEKERGVLQAMAKIAGDDVPPLQVKVPNSRKLLRVLTEKGLVVQDGRGKYSIYHPLFKQFLLSTTAKVKKVPKVKAAE